MKSKPILRQALRSLLFTGHQHLRNGSESRRFAEQAVVEGRKSGSVQSSVQEMHGHFEVTPVYARWCEFCAAGRREQLEEV